MSVQTGGVWGCSHVRVHGVGEGCGCQTRFKLYPLQPTRSHQTYTHTPHTHHSPHATRHTPHATRHTRNKEANRSMWGLLICASITVQTCGTQRGQVHTHRYIRYINHKPSHACTYTHACACTHTHARTFARVRAHTHAGHQIFNYKFWSNELRREVGVWFVCVRADA